MCNKFLNNKDDSKNDFCFVVVSYNQEDYVFQHLESIKNLILSYGSRKKIQLVFSDDCSKDATVEKAKYWIEKNQLLFNECKIIEHENNVGTIRNMIDAINSVNALCFKEMACDDLYYKNNIFDLNTNTKLVLTPTIHFFEPNTIEKKIIDDYFIFLNNRNKDIKIKIKKMLNYNQCIPSPGVILPPSVWKNEDFKNFLLKYKYIEDIPEWYYLFNVNDFNLKVEINDTPFVLYRRNVGISNHIKKKDNPIDNEYKRIRKEIVAKQDCLPKYLNPYAYMHFIQSKISVNLIKNKPEIKKSIRKWNDNVKYAAEFIKFIQENADYIEDSYMNDKR